MTRKAGGAAKKRSDAAPRFRDRIVELRRVAAGELRRNPKNWRLHSDEQRAALETLLTDIGYAGATIAYMEDGELVLLDGHLRADIADDAEVPVLVTDLNAEEADRVLASHDLVGHMADIDDAALAALLTDTELPDTLSKYAEMLIGASQHGVLIAKDITELPPLTWVLVSIPTHDYGDIAEAVDMMREVSRANVWLTTANPPNA